MVNKTKSSVLEKNNKLGRALLDSRILLELEVFTKRNALSKQINDCCPRCLKAHLIKKAKEYSLFSEIKNIESLLQEEPGHHGYYLDEDEIVKID